MLKTQKPDWYEIHIREPISESSLAWFDDCTVKVLASGETLLLAVMIDQAALHGLLARIQDLNLTLLSVNKVDKT